VAFPPAGEGGSHRVEGARQGRSRPPGSTEAPPPPLSAVTDMMQAGESRLLVDLSALRAFDVSAPGEGRAPAPSARGPGSEPRRGSRAGGDAPRGTAPVPSVS